MTTHKIRVNGQTYEFEMTPPARDGWCAVRAPGLVDFAARDLADARDKLRSAYARQPD